MEGEKKTGKEAKKILEQTEYGDFYIKSFDFNFLEHTVTMHVVAAPYDKTLRRYIDKHYIVRFTNVSKFKLEKSEDSVDEPWEGLWWASIAYIPEEKDSLYISEEEKREYDFLIEGDPFVMFIKGNLEVEPYEPEQA